MEYNTQRNRLEIMDYGRNVYKLIQYAKGIADRNKRTQVAEAIVRVMEQVNPHVRDHADYRRKLWNHLMVLANGELDVDKPFPVTHEKRVAFSPHRMEYNTGDIRYRHYGRKLEAMVHRVSEMPEGEERKALEKHLTQMMKRSYLNWNRDTVSDDVIIDQMDRMSEGRIHIDAGTEIVLPQLSSIQPDDTTARMVKNKKKKKR